MGELGLLLAPAGPVGGVLDALQDLSGLGLLDPFVWVPAEQVGPHEVAVLLVRDGVRTATTLQEVLLSRHHRRIRLCVLVPVLTGSPGVPAQVEADLDELLRGSGGGAAVDRLRCVLMRPRSGRGAADLAREGWHNVVVSPQESRGPRQPKRLLAPTDDPLDLGRHAAPAVASLVALWRDQASAPLDDQPVLPGLTLRHARTFYRRLDATTVEDELRTRVCDVSRGMPRPREQGGGAAVHVEDVELATSTMADALWRKHAAVLQGSRVAPQAVGASSIGAWAALKMVFGFLLASLRNAPGAWYAQVMNRASSAVASSVHSAVFGAAPSAYQVVVKGVTAAGTPASWQDTTEAGRELDDALRAPGERREHHQAPTSLGPLWRDYCSAALTLCDGGHRTPALPPVQVGSGVGVLRDASDCVPGDAHAFDGLSRLLAATLGEVRLQPVDVLGAHSLRLRLEELGRDEGTALEAERSKQALLRWQQDRARSFGVQVGTVLGRRVVEVGQEIRGLLLVVQDLAAGVDADAADLADQRRTARLLQLLFGLLLLAVTVPLVLAGVGVLSWGVAGGIAAGALVVWLLATVAVFVQRQRRLFQELNRRQQAQSQMEATRTNLRQALRDQRRLADAYGQFLAWSAALGTFLSEPFGATGAGSTGTGRETVVGLPANVRLGTAVPDEAAIAEAAALARRDVFAVGWLSEGFEALVVEAPRRLGPDAQDLRDDPEALFQQPSGTADSLLDAWVGDLVRHGVGTTSRDAVWGRALALVDGPGGRPERRLAAEVVPSDTSRPVPREEFMAGLDEGAAVTAEGFDGALLSLEARAAPTGEVTAWSHPVQDGLGQVVVRVDLGGGLASYLFDDGTEAQAPRPAGSDDQPVRPGWDASAPW